MQSEDDGQGEIEGQGGEVRRRKKKGLKEKLTGGKSKQEQSQTESFTSTPTTTISTGATSPGAQPEHEKKGVKEKIKEKLPGHYSH